MANWKNKFGTKSFQDFMEKFFEGSNLISGSHQFFNRKLVVAMSGDKVAEIVLATKGHQGHYKGFKTTIVHKVNGTISSQWFGFEEHLSLVASNGNTEYDYPYIIDHCGTDWYMNGATDDSVKNLTKTILDYINFYR